jgi:hypothetical protein
LTLSLTDSSKFWGIILAPSLLRLTMMIVVLVIFGLIAADLGVGLIALAMAPLGYQDETGFHFGQQHGSSQDEFPYGLPQPKLV